jgi:hypothetical protein
VTMYWRASQDCSPRPAHAAYCQRFMGRGRQSSCRRLDAHRLTLCAVVLRVGEEGRTLDPEERGRRAQGRRQLLDRIAHICRMMLFVRTEAIMLYTAALLTAGQCRVCPSERANNSGCRNMIIVVSYIKVGSFRCRHTI